MLQSTANNRNNLKYHICTGCNATINLEKIKSKIDYRVLNSLKKENLNLINVESQNKETFVSLIVKLLKDGHVVLKGSVRSV